MYNVNWREIKKEPQLMNGASYVGCCVSAGLCIITSLLLVHYRARSLATQLHHNLAAAVALTQIVFMIGITQYKHQTACRAFAVLFHYLFLAQFCWLMNETFNLYIIITYSAHVGRGGQEATAGGSMWRYYIIGWAFPAILVGAFVGTQQDGYYATDMCWIAWKNIWMFIGPPLGLIATTLLVLIFTAKEHHENSYSRNEKTNRAIMNYSKGLWTQLILLGAGWCFSFMTLRLTGSVIKYIYCMMNCLQGSFFLVFFFVVNDQVQQRRAGDRRARDDDHVTSRTSSEVTTSGDRRRSDAPAEEMTLSERPAEEEGIPLLVAESSRAVSGVNFDLDTRL